MPGGIEMLVILLIVVLLFGANKVPKLARATGQSLGEFQRGREEVERDLRERRNQNRSEQTASAESAVDGAEGGRRPSA